MKKLVLISILVLFLCMPVLQGNTFFADFIVRFQKILSDINVSCLIKEISSKPENAQFAVFGQSIHIQYYSDKDFSRFEFSSITFPAVLITVNGDDVQVTVLD